MRIVSIFKNGGNRAIRLPRDMDFGNVVELEIRREGDTITLRPIKPSWETYSKLAQTKEKYVNECPEIMEDNWSASFEDMETQTDGVEEKLSALTEVAKENFCSFSETPKENRDAS